MLSVMCLVSCSPEDDNTGGIMDVENDIDNFIYIVSDNEVHITGYSGIDHVINIPPEIGKLSVTEIKENAFKEFLYLEAVSIPDTVTSIKGAFRDCTDLKTVHIGSSVTDMTEAFSGCKKLETVIGGDNAVYMDSAFEGCVSLKAAKIPKSAKSADSAFKDCRALTSAEIEDGIDGLDNTFFGCSSLQAAHIPESINRLVSAFEGCSNLTSVSGGVGVTVYNRAFCECLRLESIALGDGVTELISAFVGCASVTSIENLPTEVEKYSPSFSGCSKLTKITVPLISDEKYLSEYSPTEDFDGCMSVKTAEILADYTVKEEFCKAFSDLSSLEALTVTDNVFEELIRVTYTYTDVFYGGDDTKIADALKKSKKENNVRITENYSEVGGKMYSHIYGGDVYYVDPDERAKEASVIGFTPFDVKTYWCGYPTGGKRTTETSAIERTYSFHLRTTGRNNSALPETVAVNGFNCTVGE